MGDVADMILDGTLCQVCGSVMSDTIPFIGNNLIPGPGYPRTCEDCEKE